MSWICESGFLCLVLEGSVVLIPLHHAHATFCRDINYLACPSPPPNAVSVKQQRERYRKQLLAAFDQNYHPDHSVPT